MVSATCKATPARRGRCGGTPSARWCAAAANPTCRQPLRQATKAVHAAAYKQGPPCDFAGAACGVQVSVCTLQSALRGTGWYAGMPLCIGRGRRADEIIKQVQGSRNLRMAPKKKQPGAKPNVQARPMFRRADALLRCMQRGGASTASMQRAAVASPHPA